MKISNVPRKQKQIIKKTAMLTYFPQLKGQGHILVQCEDLIMHEYDQQSLRSKQ